MEQGQVVAADQTALACRLRLKRRFLIAMMVSLAACALSAVAVLGFGEFNAQTWRMLGSLFGLGLHCAIAMSCAASLESRRRPVLSCVGLVAFAISFGVLLATIWWPAGSLDQPLYGILTTLSICGYYILAIPPANLLAKRRWRPLPELGLILCAAGFLATLLCIWSDDSRDIAWFSVATGVLAASAFTCAHACFLGRITVGPAHRWLVRATLVSVCIVGAIVSYMIVLEVADEFIIRALAVTGVLDASGSLALLILSRLRQVTSIQQIESASPRIEIICPRCSLHQTVDAGSSRCSACGLKFQIEIEEPRCVKCGYLLWQLPERRCPECGTTF